MSSIFYKYFQWVGKRAWNSGFTGGVGKRAWNSGFTGGVGKRAWNSGFVGGVGKRAWNAGFNGAVGKRAWNSGFSGGVGKRAWNSGFSGSVGKRDASAVDNTAEDVESDAINEVKGITFKLSSLLNVSKFKFLLLMYLSVIAILQTLFLSFRSMI